MRGHIAAMSEEPIRPDEVEITVYKYISNAIGVLERAEQVRQDAQRRLNSGVNLGDPSAVQFDKVFHE